MAYEGDLSASLAGKNDTFLNIKNILRKGFDGEVNHMDYKDETSFRGAVKIRLSALVVGTPLTIFNYFDTQSTSEGNSRRIILVEHDMIMKNITVPDYTQQEKDFIFQELDYLQNIPPQAVYHKKIEQQADKWRNEKQKQANGDTILYSAVHTPSKMFRRAAYLMWAINHFDDSTINDCCVFGKWIAEYQYRSYINQTYSDQQTEMKNWNKRKAPSTQTIAKAFNDKMLAAMPNVFTMQDIMQYRSDNGYEHDIASQAVVNRWKNQGLVAPSKNKTWVKI